MERLHFLSRFRGDETTVIAGAILIIAIAASGVLMMRFRKRWLARINIAFTNRITSLFAGWLPGFGILTHVGRKSGKVYRTPVNVFRAPNGFIIAITYSPPLVRGSAAPRATCGRRREAETRRRHNDVAEELSHEDDA